MVAKRIVAIGIAAALGAFLCGCSSEGGESSGGGSDSAGTERQDEQQAESDYIVEIGEGTLAEDYEGKPVLLVEFTWTNNSEDATSFLIAINAQGFQNGVELDTAIMMDVDTSDSMKEIKPGATQTVQQAYVLDGDSEVTVECTELISFDDTILASKNFAIA